MRRFLVLTGIVAAVAAGFLAAWPRLVDSPGLQEEVARLLRAAIGDGLRVEGAVRLELVPRPRVTLERASIDTRVGARLAADGIELRLAALPLLAGRIEPREIILERPRLALRDTAQVDWTGSIRALADGPLAGVRRVEVHDGALSLAPSAGAWLPSDAAVIDLLAVRDPVRGYRLDGSAVIAAEPVRVTATSDRLALDGPIQLTATLESGSSDQPFQADFAGRLTPGQDVDGRLSLSTARGPPPRWLTGDVPLRGSVEGRLLAGADRIQLTDLTVSLPEGQLRGALAVDRWPERGFDLALSSPALDLSDALSGTAARLVEAMRAHPGRGGRLEIDVASVTWRNGAVRRLQAEAALRADGALELRRLTAILPGEASLRWTGAGPPEGGMLAGTIAVQAAELRPLLGWLGIAEADLPAGGLTTLDLRAAARLGPDRADLRDLEVRLDASRLTGAVSYRHASRPRIDAALALDRLNLALYGGSPPGWTDWRGRLAALDGGLDLSIERLSRDLLAADGVVARLALAAGQLDLATLTVADVAGANLSLRGTLDLPSGAWDAAGDVQLPAPDLTLRPLGLPASFDLDPLGPLRLVGQSRNEAGRTSLDLRLDARGAGARLAAQWSQDPTAGPLAASATVEAADATALLGALGWPAPTDPPQLGPLHVHATATRETGPIAIEGAASVGDDRLELDLDLTADTSPAGLRGTVRALRLDTVLLSAVYQTLALPLGAPPGNPLLWPGTWPRAPLRWTWLDRLRLDLALDIEQLRHAGRDVGKAAMRATMAEGALELPHIDLPVADGRLDGRMRLARRGGYAVLGADLRLRDARAGDIAAASAPGTALRGIVDLVLTAEAQGRSVADLVGSLSGTGTVDLRDAELAGVALDGSTTGGAAPVLSGAALRGPFALADGTLASAAPGLALTAGDRAASVDLRLDLLAWILEARVTAGDTVRRYLGPPGRILPVPAP